MKKLCMALIFFITSSFCLSTQAAQSNSVKAIVGATLLDINGKNDIDNVVLIVSGEKISAIGSRDDTSIPDNAEIIDATGHWLVPGLMNMHVHLGFLMPGKQKAELANESEGELTLRMADNARKVLRAGITTIRIPSDQRHGDLALKKAIAKGQAIGPRIFSAGEPLAITGGHGSDKGQTFYDGPYELMKAARQQISAGASWIKILISGGIATNGGDISVALMTPEEINAVVDVAHRFGAKVAAHSGSPAATNIAIDAGIDSIEHGYFLDRKTIRKMKKQGTWLVPTIIVSQPAMVPFYKKIGVPDWYMERQKSVGIAHWKALQMAIKEKVNIALGTDQLPSVPTDGAIATVREAEYYVEAGMSPLQALRAATIEPAKMLGADDNSGSLEVGKYADILVIENNPAENISALRHIKLVMKGGEVYSNLLGK
jgi:imidazolonepropionase-like amidohydrolase